MVLWSSQVVSTVGTRVTSIAYPLLVLAVTHSPARAGVVGFAQTLPFLLLYLPAGTFVDRWDRKRTMLVCDAGRAVALGSIAITVALGWLTMAQVVVVALIEGSLFVLFDLAEGAALPQLVTGEQLQTAIAQNQAKTQGADIVGQPLGGVLFSAARLLPFLVDAVSYLVSFIALLFIRRPLQQPRARQPTRLRTEIAEGLRWVWRQPFLRAAVGVIGGVNFVFNALTLVLVVRARELGASPALIGVMFAFVGVGGLLGSFVAPWVPAPATITGQETPKRSADRRQQRRGQTADLNSAQITLIRPRKLSNRGARVARNGGSMRGSLTKGGTLRDCWRSTAGVNAAACGGLPGRDAERCAVGPAVVLGQDLTEAAGPVRHGAVADLATGDRQLGNGHREAAGR
jgi:MFS family permease